MQAGYGRLVDSDFDARLQRLREALAEVGQLLQDFGEEHWLAWFARCQVALDASNSAAFNQILSAFGGMGSFNDLVLHRRGQELRSSVEVALEGRGWSKEERAANYRLGELRTVIWTEATALRAELRPQ